MDDESVDDVVWVAATPVPGPTRTERCPEGGCRSIAHAYPQANQDRDSNFWTCAYCGGDLCSACNSRPAPYLGAFCAECDGDDGDECVIRMEQERPSEVTDTAWVWAEVEGTRKARQASDGGGKWMIFAESWAEHDANWLRVVGALDRLGGVTKASTRYREPGEHGATMVYARDVDDMQDVLRVLGVLRDLGFDGWLKYKADSTTMHLAYGKGASCYSSRPGD